MVCRACAQQACRRAARSWCRLGASARCLLSLSAGQCVDASLLAGALQDDLTALVAGADMDGDGEVGAGRAT